MVFVAVPVGLLIPFAFYYAATGAPLEESITALVDLSDPTPAGLAYLNLALASAIPVTWFLERFLHDLKPRWLSSVRPRLRWTYFVVCIGLAMVSLLATLLVSAVLPDQGGPEITGGAQRLHHRRRATSSWSCCCSRRSRRRGRSTSSGAT